ncbi:PepSY-associated TM helix domain-containing protein [Streptomyces chromofuscus]|uniref:PepSY-associated TM helix domain-containing protein n=1 Tax=Streptomyces chromofuscus TaxID=42881 RepID=UPI0035711365
MPSAQEHVPQSHAHQPVAAMVESTDPAGTPPPAGEGHSPRRRRSWKGARALFVRLHFYAGVFVAPLLLVAAFTGLAYTFTPQLDRLVYSEQLRVEEVGTAPRPLGDQIIAAQEAHPEGTLASVITPSGPEDTTRVVLSVPELGEKQRTVFVDPYTAEVQGELTTWYGSTPLTTWLDDLHRNLHLGEAGRLYSETAASWLWVIVAGGLLLWLGRVRGRRTGSARDILLPDRGARGVRRTRSLHAATGAWLAIGLFGLSATGLTWSRYAGDRFGEFLDATDGRAPALVTTLPGDARAEEGDHAEHAGPGAPGAEVSVDPAHFDSALAAARAVGLGGKVEVTPPADDANAWTVAQDDPQWPVHYDRVAVDPVTGHVTSESRWADYPPSAKLSKLGVQAHMGRLFGVANQILLALIALGLIFVILWGYRMWWQRRPTRTTRLGRAPARGAWRRVPLPLLLTGVPTVAAVGWALPVLGVTLLGFLVVDAAVGVIRRARTGAAT